MDASKWILGIPAKIFRLKVRKFSKFSPRKISSAKMFLWTHRSQEAYVFHGVSSILLFETFVTRRGQNISQRYCDVCYWLQCWLSYRFQWSQFCIVWLVNEIWGDRWSSVLLQLVWLSSTDNMIVQKNCSSWNSSCLRLLIPTVSSFSFELALIACVNHESDLHLQYHLKFPFVAVYENKISHLTLLFWCLAFPNTFSTT